MDALSRLAWALPLVLLVGGAAILVLKRFLVPIRPASQSAHRMNLRESLSVSDDTRVHLIEIECKSYLIVESARHAVLHSAAAQTDERTRVPMVLGPSWARRRYQARAR